MSNVNDVLELVPAGSWAPASYYVPTKIAKRLHSFRRSVRAKVVFAPAWGTIRAEVERTEDVDHVVKELLDALGPYVETLKRLHGISSSNDDGEKSLESEGDKLSLRLKFSTKYANSFVREVVDPDKILDLSTRFNVSTVELEHGFRIAPTVYLDSRWGEALRLSELMEGLYGIVTFELKGIYLNPISNKVSITFILCDIVPVRLSKEPNKYHSDTFLSHV
jgi:hypothetical protein